MAGTEPTPPEIGARVVDLFFLDRRTATVTMHSDGGDFLIEFDDNGNAAWRWAGDVELLTEVPVDPVGDLEGPESDGFFVNIPHDADHRYVASTLRRLADALDPPAAVLADKETPDAR